MTPTDRIVTIKGLGPNAGNENESHAFGFVEMSVCGLSESYYSFSPTPSLTRPVVFAGPPLSLSLSEFSLSPPQTFFYIHVICSELGTFSISIG